MTALARRATALRERHDLGTIGAGLVPFALIVFLAMNNGGYDVVERSQAGIVVWWVVLVGTLAGFLTPAGGTRAGAVMLSLLALFALWTALALSWTESAERTMIEVGRVVMYLGVFALALAIQGRGRWRGMLAGVIAGMACIIAIAVLSRVEPTWFPHPTTARFLGGAKLQSRLAYPINYSTGLAAFTAAGMPLFLALASSHRNIVLRGLAGGVISIAALALWLTGSSLTIPLTAIGLVVFIALAPDRLPKLAMLVPGALGGLVAIVELNQRDALDRGLRSPTAQHQGHEMLAILIGIVVLVALAQIGLALALKRLERPRWLRVSPRAALAAVGAGLVAALVIAIAVGAPGDLSRQWSQFKHNQHVTPKSGRSAEIVDVSSSGRYSYWRAAIDAGKSEPLVGIGPGTFEFWWGRHASFPIFVRDAHSLYFETFGELGVIGLILMVGFTGGALGIGVARLTRGPPGMRFALAAVLASLTVLVAGALVDWLWELGAIQVIFMTLAAVAIAGGVEPTAAPVAESAGSMRARVARWAPAAGIAIASVAALVAIAIPLTGAAAIDSSRADAADGRFADALGEARAAQGIQPYAATPRLQEALVLEREHDLDGAAAAARQAAARERTNWRVWLTLARIETERSDLASAGRAYRTAKSLDPVPSQLR